MYISFTELNLLRIYFPSRVVHDSNNVSHYIPFCLFLYYFSHFVTRAEQSFAVRRFFFYTFVRFWGLRVCVFFHKCVPLQQNHCQFTTKILSVLQYFITFKTIIFTNHERKFLSPSGEDQADEWAA